MTQVKVQSRRIFLGAAFVGAMAGSGALFGLIGGLMLVLLSRAVLNIDGATASLLIASGAIGLAAATIWSLFLVVRQGNHALSWNQVAAVPQGGEGN